MKHKVHDQSSSVDRFHILSGHILICTVTGLKNKKIKKGIYLPTTCDCFLDRLFEE